MTNAHKKQNAITTKNIHDKCGDQPFTLSYVEQTVAPPSATVKVENGKLKLDINYISPQKEASRRGVCKGLHHLKVLLESKCPTFVVFPGNRDLSKEPVLLCFEVFGTGQSHKAIWANLCRIDSNLVDVGHLVAASPTSNIRCQYTGKQFSGTGGYRFYFLAKGDSDINRYRESFSMRLWAYGLSGVRLVGPSEYSIREYINADSFIAEHGLSEVPVQLGKGLTQDRPAIEYHPGGLLNTKPFPRLDSFEKYRLVSACAEAIAKFPLSSDAANTDRLARAIWQSVHHDAKKSREEADACDINNGQQNAARNNNKRIKT